MNLFIFLRSSSSSNIPEIEHGVSSPCSTHTSDRSQSPYIPECNDTEDQDGVSSVSGPIPSPLTTKRAAKRRRNTEDKENELLRKELASVNSELSSIVQAESKDDLHYFALSIAAKMRKLSDYQQAVARKEIENIIFQIQYSLPQTYCNANTTYCQTTTPITNNTTSVPIQPIYQETPAAINNSATSPDDRLTYINLG